MERRRPMKRTRLDFDPLEGVINAWFADREYGFITGEDGKSYWCHKQFCDFDPQAGDRVVFTPTPHPKGMRATAVFLDEDEEDSDGTEE